MSVENSTNGKDDSEREEGEIVELSDFGGVNTVLIDSNVLDDISSEEEFELRERIAELEARNLELEKIASISNTKYDLKCARDQQNLDILNKGSLVSYGKNNGKVLGSTLTTHRRRRRRSRRKNSSQSKRDQHRRIRSTSSDFRQGRESSRRVKKRKRSRYSSSSSEDSDGFSLYSRKELEAALFRGDKKKISPSVVISDDDEKILKLRLKALQSTNEIKEGPKSDSGEDTKEEFEREKAEGVEDECIEEDEEQKALEEQELRLIALKSAYIKKYEVRKKKKLMMETRPYSPTDDVIHLPVEIPVVNLVGSTDYSDNNMDISPINTPPREPEESYYRPVDMDLAFSGNSNSPISYVQQLFADDPLFKDNLTDEVMSESKDEEEIMEPPEPPVISGVKNEPIVPHIVNDVPIIPLTVIDVPMNPPINVPLKLQTQKSEDTLTDISLEADCLRSLLLSNLNKNRSKRAKENACPEPPKTPTIPLAKKKEESIILTPSIKSTSPIVIPNPNDCDSSKNSSKLSEISNNIIQINKSVSNSSPNPNTIEKALLTAPIVNKLIIHLGQSSSSSDSNDATSSSDANSSHESDSDSNMIRKCASNEKENTSSNHNFQEKLDQYLKTVRSKLNDTKKDSTGKQNPLNIKSTINLNNIKVNNSNLGGVASTPVAVRHLPLSSQLEYKRLINRMKLLEKQKSEKIVIAVNNNKESRVVNIQQTHTASIAPAITSKVTTVVSKSSTKLILKPKKIVNTNNPTTTVNNSITNNNSTTVDENEKLIKSLATMNDEEKIGILNKVEASYSNQSAIFLNDIDTLVELIRHAQTEKIKQVKLEQNIIELRKKLKLMESDLTEQKTSLKKIYPKIFTSHKNIIEDRKKCRSYDEFCLKIGKLVKGEDYMSPFDKKTMFIEKIKKLSDENKKLKQINIETITIQEIEKTIDEAQHEEEVPRDNTKKTNYISPLEFMKPTTENIFNPNGVLCPFELTGKCEDSQCHYEHLTNAAVAVLEPTLSK